MAVIRCRVCHLPFTESEAPAGVCPSCTPVPEAPTAVPPRPVTISFEPPPLVVAPVRSGRWLVWPAAVLIGAGLLAWAHFNRIDEPDELPALRAAKQAAETQARDFDLAAQRVTTEHQAVVDRLAAAEALAKGAGLEKAAAEERAHAAEAILEQIMIREIALQEELIASRQVTHPKPATTARLEVVAPAPVAQPAQPAQPDLRNRVAPRPVDAPGERVPDVQAVAVQAPDGEGFEIVRLDRPDDIHGIPPLNNGVRIKLVGRVRSLRVDGLNGGSALDASELQAGDIVLTGNVNAGAQLRLHTAGGTVRVPDINGDSWVQIDAPDGRVSVGHISGAAQVAITAKDVEFREAISGSGSRVAVTLTRGGSLKFREVQGGAKLTWKKAGTRDPDPRIEAGRVRDGSNFRQVK